MPLRHGGAGDIERIRNDRRIPSGVRARGDRLIASPTATPGAESGGVAPRRRARRGADPRVGAPGIVAAAVGCVLCAAPTTSTDSLMPATTWRPVPGLPGAWQNVFAGVAYRIVPEAASAQGRAVWAVYADGTYTEPAASLKAAKAVVSRLAREQRARRTHLP
ncbi:hypothetical protein tb265_00360 [Gemmatimonadetes bacterium T265]|nr:hypothetical protein tb265_00360 [Gemmatimonadetes bacterium T265]